MNPYKTGEADLRLILWSDVISKIAPKSRIFLIPFFDSKKAYSCFAKQHKEALKQIAC